MSTEPEKQISVYKYHDLITNKMYRAYVPGERNELPIEHGARCKFCAFEFDLPACARSPSCSFLDRDDGLNIFWMKIK